MRRKFALNATNAWMFAPRVLWMAKDGKMYIVAPLTAAAGVVLPFVLLAISKEAVPEITDLEWKSKDILQALS